MAHASSLLEASSSFFFFKHLQDYCLEQFIKCPICFDRLVPPLDTCIEGHGVCMKCRSQENCIICDKAFSTNKNTLLNALLESIPMPCEFQYLGCRVTKIKTEISDHEKICFFREGASDVCHVCFKNNKIPLCELCYNYSPCSVKSSLQELQPKLLEMDSMMESLVTQLNPCLQDLTECTICTGTLTPPLETCVNGHGFCGGCTYQLENCPVCREAFILESQNTLLNDILKSIPLACKFKFLDEREQKIYTDIQDEFEKNHSLRENYIEMCNICLEEKKIPLCEFCYDEHCHYFLDDYL